MIELEVKLGPKTGLDTVQNEKHVEVEVASPDDSNQAPLVRVTNLEQDLSLQCQTPLSDLKFRCWSLNCM